MKAAWTRPPMTASGPDRSPRGMFREADSAAGRRGARKPTLGVDKDDLFRLVEGAYDIADRQIERGMEAARALRGASVRSGLGEPSEVVGRTERLSQDTAMLVLEWLSVLSAARSGGLRDALTSRLPALDMIWDELLGLADPMRPRTQTAKAPASPAPAAASEPPRRRRFDLDLRHLEAQRVAVLDWHGVGTVPSGECVLVFSSRGQPGTAFTATLRPQQAELPLLEVRFPDGLQAGTWRAALCDRDGTQTGRLEIEL